MYNIFKPFLPRNKRLAVWPLAIREAVRAHVPPKPFERPPGSFDNQYNHNGYRVSCIASFLMFSRSINL